MKTQPTPTGPNPGRTLRLCLISAISLIPHAQAQFSGSDSLAVKSPNWDLLYQDSERENWVNRDGHLAFTNDKNDKHSYLKWTPNRGSADQDWFVQVAVTVGGSDDIGIGVVNTRDKERGCTFLLTRSWSEGFIVDELRGSFSQFTLNSADKAKLRLHFNSKEGTLTASFKTRLSWHYLEPVPVSKLGLDECTSFTAVLVGEYQGNPDDDDDDTRYYGFEGKSDRPFFTHFKCGPASPFTVVELSPENRLESGTSKLSFGTAETGGKGVTRSLTIRNEGTSTLRDLKLTKSGTHRADFQLAKLPAHSLAPGEATTVQITFQPRSKGAQSAELHILSNDASQPSFDIRLTGLGARE